MGRFHDETFIRFRQIVFENLIYLGSTLEYWEMWWVRWWTTTKLFLNVSISEYHTFSNVEFQRHSRIDNKPMYMKILTVWALTSEKNIRNEFPGSTRSTHVWTHVWKFRICVEINSCAMSHEIMKLSFE